MPNAKMLAARLVGGLQCVLGAGTAVLAYLTLSNAELRGALGVSDAETFLVVFLMMMFSVFSALSGIVLVRYEG